MSGLRCCSSTSATTSTPPPPLQLSSSPLQSSLSYPRQWTRRPQRTQRPPSLLDLPLSALQRPSNAVPAGVMRSTASFPSSSSNLLMPPPPPRSLALPRVLQLHSPSSLFVSSHSGPMSSSLSPPSKPLPTPTSSSQTVPSTAAETQLLRAVVTTVFSPDPSISSASPSPLPAVVPSRPLSSTTSSLTADSWQKSAIADELKRAEKRAKKAIDRVVREREKQGEGQLWPCTHQCGCEAVMTRPQSLYKHIRNPLLHWACMEGQCRHWLLCHDGERQGKTAAEATSPPSSSASTCPSPSSATPAVSLPTVPSSDPASSASSAHSLSAEPFTLPLISSYPLSSAAFSPSSWFNPIIESESEDPQDRAEEVKTREDTTTSPIHPHPAVRMSSSSSPSPSSTPASLVPSSTHSLLLLGNPIPSLSSPSEHLSSRGYERSNRVAVGWEGVGRARRTEEECKEERDEESKEESGVTGEDEEEGEEVMEDEDGESAGEEKEEEALALSRPRRVAAVAANLAMQRQSWGTQRNPRPPKTATSGGTKGEEEEMAEEEEEEEAPAATVVIPSLSSCFVAGHQDLPPRPTSPLSQDDAGACKNLTNSQRKAVLYALSELGQGLVPPENQDDSTSAHSLGPAQLLRWRVRRIIDIIGRPVRRANRVTYRLISKRYIRSLEKHVAQYGITEKLTQRLDLIIQAEEEERKEARQEGNSSDDGEEKGESNGEGLDVAEEVDAEEEVEELREGPTLRKRGAGNASVREGEKRGRRQSEGLSSEGQEEKDEEEKQGEARHSELPISSSSGKRKATEELQAPTSSRKAVRVVDRQISGGPDASGDEKKEEGAEWSELSYLLDQREKLGLLKRAMAADAEVERLRRTLQLNRHSNTSVHRASRGGGTD